MARRSRSSWLAGVALLLVAALVLLWRLSRSAEESGAAPSATPTQVTPQRAVPGLASMHELAEQLEWIDKAWVDPLDPKNHGAIVGRVRFADGSAPATLHVALSSHHGDVTRTGDAFRIVGVPKGMHPFRVSGDFLSPPMRPVAVKAGEDTDVGELIVARGRTLAGRVVDARGAPVPDANVIAGERLGCDARSTGQVFGKGATTTTDQDGRFTFANLVPARLVLVGERGATGRSRPMPIEAGDEDREVTLTLEELAGLAGRVSGAESDGDTGVRSTVRVSPKESIKDSVELRCAVQVEADGTFQLDHLLAGTYVVTAETLMPMDGDRSVIRERRAEATLRAGETTTIDLDLVPGKGGVDLVIETTGIGSRWITRHVLFRGPLFQGTQAQLDALLLRTPEAWQTSGSRDRAALHDVPPGSYTLCTVGFPPLDSTVMLEYIRDVVLDLPADCRSVEVAASPAEQVIKFALAPPARSAR